MILKRGLAIKPFMTNTMPKDNLGNDFSPFTNHGACPLGTHFGALQEKSSSRTVRIDSLWGKTPLRIPCQAQAPFDQLEQVLLGLDYFLKYFPT